MIYTAVATKLREFAGVGTTVAPSTEQALVTESLPRVLYTDLGGERTYSDSGNTGIVPARFQIDVFAASLSVAHAIATGIRVGLDGFAGTVDGTPILRIRADGSQRFGKVDKAAGADRAVVRLIVDLVITYREPLTP